MAVAVLDFLAAGMAWFFPVCFGCILELYPVTLLIRRAIENANEFVFLKPKASGAVHFSAVKNHFARLWGAC